MVLANCSSRVKENLSYLSGLKLNESNPKSGFLYDNDSKEKTLHNIEVLNSEKKFMEEIDEQVKASQDLHNITRMKLRALT